MDSTDAELVSAHPGDLMFLLSIPYDSNGTPRLTSLTREGKDVVSTLTEFIGPFECPDEEATLINEFLPGTGADGSAVTERVFEIHDEDNGDIMATVVRL